MKSDEVTLDFTESGLENFQGWRLHNVSRKSVAMPDCLLSENNLPYIHSESLLRQFMSIASCSPAMPYCEQITLLSVANLQVWGVWWVNLGWTLGAHQAALSLRFSNGQGRKVPQKTHGLSTGRLLSNYCHRQK